MKLANIVFAGKGRPLSQSGFDAAVKKLDVHAPTLWAVLAVETRGFGFLADRRPVILFERHIFHERTGGKFSASHPEVSNPKPGGYGAGGAHQYDRLATAIALDRNAALESASWGLGQVMGFNAASVGFASVTVMVTEMVDSEDAQIASVIGFVERNGLAKFLKAHDWTGFAQRYNGPSFTINKYHTKLEQFHNLYTLHPPPDLNVRFAQAALLYLGFNPKGIDGVFGKGTQEALIKYQKSKKLPEDGKLSPSIMSELEKDAFP